MVRRVTFVSVMLLLVTSWTYASVALPATVKVWDTAVPLGLTPGVSVEDPTGLTGHGTTLPTIVTAYARSTYPGAPSGVVYWNPDSNTFVLYGVTSSGPYPGYPDPTAPEPMKPPSTGIPGGVDINRGGGPVLAGGPCGTSFGAGDVWVGGQQNQPLYVHLAGTDCFRSYGADNRLTGPFGEAWGVKVDASTGDVYVAQPWERRIIRVHPSDGFVTAWNFGDSCNSATCGNPSSVTVDRAGLPYTTSYSSVLGDAIIRVNPGTDGILGDADDTITVWPIPTVNGVSAFRRPPMFLEESAQFGNPDGLAVDANGSMWFAMTNANAIGRLSPGPSGVLGTAGDQICVYTTAGLLNPQQIAVTGSASQVQALFTEGDGNSVSVLAQAQADLAGSVCTPVAPSTFATPVLFATAAMLDQTVPPVRWVITPTVFQVAGIDAGTGIVRFSPMPNPLLSLGGAPSGDAGNGFPSGLTGVYGGNRIAGAYLKGNKHFEVTSGAIIGSP